MDYDNYLVSVSFNIKGERVDPGEMTKILDIQCSIGRQKGFVINKNRDGIPTRARTGVWILNSDLRSRSIPAHLSFLANKISYSHDELRKLHAFDEAFFDIFLALNPGEPTGSSSLSFDMEPDLLHTLDRLGYPVRWTIDHVEGD